MHTINSPKAPKAVGPYSHAVRFGKLIFLSGQIPLDPKTMELVDGGIEAQVEQVFTNMRAVLEATGCTAFADVVKTTIFLTDMADFPKVNELYAEAFGDHKPARSTVEVCALPMGALVEIECVAVLKI